jgi:ferritin-like metal-binding protein YciE
MFVEKTLNEEKETDLLLTTIAECFVNERAKSEQE